MKNLRKKLTALDIAAAVLLIIGMIYLLIFSVKIFIPYASQPTPEGTPAEKFIIAFGSSLALAVVVAILVTFAFCGLIVGCYSLIVSLFCMKKIDAKGNLIAKRSYLILQISSLILQLAAIAVSLAFAFSLPLPYLPVPLLCAGCMICLISGAALKSKFLRKHIAAEENP